MLLADIFNQNPFSAVQLTANINVVPNEFGRLRALNLFRAEGVPTTSVNIAYEQGVVTLLPTRQRGGPPSLGLPTRRHVRPFNLLHIPHDDYVTSEDVQNLLAYGGNVLENVEAVVNRKIVAMRRKHAQTLEHLRMGALKGVIIDADGSTLLNLFSEFGITEKAVNFVFATNTTDIVAKCREVVTHMEDNLNGETMTGVHALCSPGFFASLVGHATVKEAFKFYASTRNPNRGEVRNIFDFGGITFEEYRGSASAVNENGTFTVRKFVPDNEARFFPLGTTETFATYFGPPTILAEANTIGEELYVRTSLDPEFGRWIKLHSQSSPLPIVTRPSLLVKGTSA